VWFASNAPLAQKSFLTHPLEILGDVGHLESHFPPFGDSVSIGARYYAECTIGSVLGDMAQLEARIGPFGDSANLDAR
jgi:hypothetical protein